MSEDNFDISLVKAAQGDSEAAQAQIIRYFFPIVRKISRSYFIYGGDYEDIFQEGLIGLMGAIKSYDCEKGGSFINYAKLCINRSIVSAIKQAGRKKHMPLNSSVDLDGSVAALYDSPEDLVLVKERLGLVGRMIDSKLSSFEKKVLNLYLSGLTNMEISSRLGRDKKAVENAIFRIRKKLAQ